MIRVVCQGIWVIWVSRKRPLIQFLRAIEVLVLLSEEDGEVVQVVGIGGVGLDGLLKKRSRADHVFALMLQKQRILCKKLAVPGIRGDCALECVFSSFGAGLPCYGTASSICHAAKRLGRILNGRATT